MSVGFPEPGELFVDKYRVHSILGSGGFARVYRAVQSDLDRDVALKILRPPVDDSMSSSARSSYLERISIRFQQEARLVSKLKSPHTITMYDYGRTDGGLLYMVLEYINGITLSELLDPGKPIEPKRVAKILRQVLASLHEAHALDMLHRDLKPANIMIFEHLGEPDQVKLLDFGIAKLVGESKNQQRDLTSDGNIIGTPRYMSPEQIRGGKMSAASDIYSMGLVAYELLTGHQAIADNSSLQIITKQIAPESFELPEDLPIHPEMRAVVNRMLRKNAAERYDSALAVINDLAAIDFDAPPADRVATTDLTQQFFDGYDDEEASEVADDFDEFAQPPIKKVLPLIVGALVLVVLAVIGVATLSSGNDQPDEEIPLGNSPASAEAPRDPTPAEAGPNEPAPSQAEAPTVAAREAHKIAVRSEPDGAQISVNASVLGTAPLELDTSAIQFPAVVSATLNGTTQHKTVEGKEATLVFTLVPNEPEPPKPANDDSAKPPAPSQPTRTNAPARSATGASRSTGSSATEGGKTQRTARPADKTADSGKKAPAPSEEKAEKPTKEPAKPAEEPKKRRTSFEYMPVD